MVSFREVLINCIVKNKIFQNVILMAPYYAFIIIFIGRHLMPSYYFYSVFGDFCKKKKEKKKAKFSIQLNKSLYVTPKDHNVKIRNNVLISECMIDVTAEAQI